MKTRLAGTLALLMFATGLLPAAQANALGVIVGSVDRAPDARARAEGRAVSSLEWHDGRLVIKHRHVENPRDARTYAMQLEQRPWVMAAGIDQPVRAFGLGTMSAVSLPERSALAPTANDFFRSAQWNLDAMAAEVAYDYATGAGRIVAIVDSGVEADHPDLRGQVISGADFVSGGNGHFDPFGHGTHVAGTVAAKSNNGVGVASIAPDARIMPVRVLDENGGGFDSDVANGIIYAADHGATVINLSLGGPTDNPILAAAVQYALDRDVVVVAAAGNEAESGNDINYPCAYTEVICVGAVDRNKNRASFSNFGSQVDIVAPGVDIASTAFGDYFAVDGTSMASPHVAAAAALLRQRYGYLSRTQIADRIFNTAQDRGVTGRDDQYGFGFVDAPAALSRNPQPVTYEPVDGYWLVGRDGGVFSFGNVAFYGSTGNIVLNQPIVAMAAVPAGDGYRFVASDGGVFSYGSAAFFGSTGNLRLNQPIVGMANTPTGNGYWLVARDGGIFAFGDAGFYGSTGDLKLNQPVVGMTATPTGNGYWMVASDGGIFAFGDAAFYGSTGNLKLNRPVVGMASTRSGHGYWMVASDGGLFSFGDASFSGSAVGRATDVTSITTYGRGYLLTNADGKAYAYGDGLAVPAAVLGPYFGARLAAPVVGGSVAIRR